MEKRVKIRDLPKEKRMEYIWDYYWVHIVVTIAVIAVGGYLLYSSLAYREPLLNVVMINTYKTAQEQEQVLRDFLDHSGYETFSNAASVNTNIRFGIGENDDAISTNQLMCSVNAGEGDLYFWTGEEFSPYIGRGALADLREYLPSEFLDRLKDRLFYTDGQEGAYPCGIDLTGNPWAQEHGYINGGYVGIGYGIENKETGVKLIEEIFKEP